MSRPGPLQELPIQLFVQNDGGSPNLGLKRPLSPGSHSSQHAKRRLLESPSRSANTPASQKTSRYAENVDYTSVLRGPDSPARVLNFGAADGQRTPRSKLHPDTPLPPSPKLKTYTAPEASTSKGSSTRAPHVPHPIVFDLVPRILPPLTDPESVHYPGFDVHRDPFEVVGRRDESRMMEALPDPDGDLHKENSCPPREIKTPASQFTTIHSESTMSMVMSPDLKGKQRMIIDGTAQLSLNHKRIFGNGFEDDIIDLSGSAYGLHRLSRMSSNSLDDTAPAYGSPLWQTHFEGT